MAGECPSPVLGGGLPAAVVKRAKVIAPLQGASFNEESFLSLRRNLTAIFLFVRSLNRFRYLLPGGALLIRL